MKSQQVKIQKILKNYFQLQKKKNPSFSLRSLARGLKMSPSFVSEVLAGKKKVPLRRLSEMMTKLGMDDLGRFQIRDALFDSAEHAFESPVRSKAETLRDEGDYSLKSTSDIFLFTHWYDVAILDLAACTHDTWSVKTLSKHLGIQSSAIRASVNKLMSAGFLELTKYGLKKTSQKIRFPTKGSIPAVRRYHEMMIKHSMFELSTKTQPSDAARRLFIGLTFSCKSEKIQEAIQNLHRVIYEEANQLSEGDCNEVYQLNLQFFPLTAKGEVAGEVDSVGELPGSQRLGSS